MDYDVEFILNEGSQIFKQQLDQVKDALRVSRENALSGSIAYNLNKLIEIHNKLDYQENLLTRESARSIYTENQKVTMKTYIDKLNEVIGLVQNRINELSSSEQNNGEQVPDTVSDQTSESHDSDLENDAYARSMGISVRRRGGRKSRRSRKSTSRKSRRSRKSRKSRKYRR